MNRAVVGIYEPGGSPGERLALARSALCGEGPVRGASMGALALAWTGASEPGQDPLWLLVGELHEPAVLDGPPEPGVLDSLRGEFAIVAWDTARERGLVARDHVGAGSLFWHDDGRRLIFASEVRQLLRALRTRPAPDELALARWLTGRSATDGRTLFEGVRSLPPGSWLALERGKRRPQRYWNLPYRAPELLTPSDAAAAVSAGLEQAVARRLRPHGSAGVMLSGGLDSTSLATIAHGMAGKDEMRAYSAVFPRHPHIDESELIARTAARLGLDGARIVVEGGSPLAGGLTYLDRWMLPAPPPTHYLWQPLVERAAVEGTRRLLDGEAGDELFGVAPYLLADRLRSGRAFAALRLARRFPGSGARPRARVVGHLLGRYGVAGALPPVLDRRPAAPPWLRRGGAIRLTEDEPLPWKRCEGPRWWAQLAYQTRWGADAIGACDYFRRRAASAGVTSHHPFLDVDLIELALRLEPELAFDPGLDRPVLRAAMRGRVDDEIRLRPDKSRFNDFLSEALSKTDLQPLQTLLAARDSELRAYVRPDALGQLAGPPPTGHAGRLAAWSARVWRLAGAECFLRSQADASFAPRMAAQCSLAPPPWRLEPLRRGTPAGGYGALDNGSSLRKSARS